MVLRLMRCTICNNYVRKNGWLQCLDEMMDHLQTVHPKEYKDAEKHNELLAIEIIDTFYKLWAQRKVLYDPEPYPLEWIPEQYNRYFPLGAPLDWE